MDADIYSIALENVERLIAGKITEPSPGTLAARVLEWADKRACEKVPVVTVTHSITPLGESHAALR